MERLPLAAAAVGQSPRTTGRPVAPFILEIPSVSTAPVGEIPFQCLLQPVTFWYINNYPLDSGDIAFPASLPLPLSSCPALVYRPSVASGVKNGSVPRAEVETGKHTKLNRIAKPSILCLCSNMCCYTGILKSPLHST